MYQTILSEIRKSINVELGNDVWNIIYSFIYNKHPIAVIIKDKIKELNQEYQQYLKFPHTFMHTRRSCAYMIDNNHIKWHWYMELNRNNDNFANYYYRNKIIDELEYLFNDKIGNRQEITDMGFNANGFCPKKKQKYIKYAPRPTGFAFSSEN